MKLNKVHVGEALEDIETKVKEFFDGEYENHILLITVMGDPKTGKYQVTTIEYEAAEYSFWLFLDCYREPHSAVAKYLLTTR